MRSIGFRCLEWFRNKAFWLLDIVKGSPVKTHFKQIASVLETTAQEHPKPKKALEHILSHAATTVPYYKSLHIKTHTLEVFPVLDKNIINANHKNFVALPFANKANIVRQTSGSTGTPFKIYQDKNKVYRNTADNLYFSKKVGYKVGYALYYLRHWNAAYKKSALENWLQNLNPVEVVNFTSSEMEILLKRLKKSQFKKSVIGFPSAFELLCKHLDAKNSKPSILNLKSAIGMAEALNSYTKARMQYYFNVNTLSRYSNMEAGIIAQQTLEYGDNFVVNTASYHVEILNINNNTPVEHGQIGRIVITDLYNHAMPLIRYDTGDLGILNTVSGQLVFTKIEGRKTDTIYDTKGQVVSSFMMTDIINYPNIKQVQFIQHDASIYELKLNVTPNFDGEEKLKAKFLKFLGNDAHIVINYVNDIPLLKSGKRKYTLNLIKH